MYFHSKFTQMFNTAKNIVFLEVGKDKIILNVSLGAEKIFKYSSKELVGKPISFLFSSEQEVDYEKIFTDKIFEGELLFINKDGNDLWLLIFVYPFFNREYNSKEYLMVGIDITKSKQIEKQLAEKQDRLEKIQLAANDGIWDWNLITNDTYFDDRYYTMAGYEPNEFPGRLEEFQKRVHPDDLNKVMVDAKKHLDGEIPRFEVEFRFKRKDGTWMWILGQGIIVERDDEGNPIRFVGTHTDITKLKKVEQKYKRLSFLKNAILESPKDIVVFALDNEYRYLYFSPKHKNIMKMLWGVDIEEGHNMLEYIDIPNDRKIAKENFDRALRGEYFVLFEEYGDVARRYYENRYAPIYDDFNNIVGVSVFVIDITRIKVAENALRKQEEEYRRIFEGSEDIIFISDIEKGRLLSVNPAGVKFLGYTKDELLNMNIIDFYYDPNRRFEFLDELKKKEYVSNFELVLKKKNGEKLIGLLSGKLIYDEKNKLIGFHGIFRDITKLKNLERQLAQSQKMEAIGVLAGGIAHDFNNILTVINGYAEISLMKLEKGSDLYNNISFILEASKKAEVLIKQLLAFSRQQVFEPKVLNINKVILSLDKMLRRIIGEDIDINIYIKDDIPNIKADRSQIEQILLNLVVNARDALRTLKVDDRKKSIVIETGEAVFDDKIILDKPGAKPGRYVCFSVSDNGIGMDREIQQKVFEPFFTTKEEGKGTGLGLSMVYGIVKQNKGYVYIYSEPSVGTTVKIYWPVFDSQEIREEENVNNADLHFEGNEAVLLVEDQEIVRNVEKEALEMFGYKVYMAENGKDALQFLKANKDLKIDLIVTDIVMPEMNGKDFIDKALKINKEFKVIFTSGYVESHIFDSRLLAEDIHFIHKPFAVEDFLKFVRKVLNKK